MVNLCIHFYPWYERVNFYVLVDTFMSLSVAGAYQRYEKVAEIN